jgi:uroporphyrinogen-III synthase
MNLANLRIVITRPAAQAVDFAERLASLGAIPIVFPTIQVETLRDNPELDRALTNLHNYDWLVITSVNGVAAIFERLSALGIHRLPGSLKVAAIGPQTAAALRSVGVQPDFVPQEYIAEAILPGLGNLLHLKVLLLRADIARPALTESIRQAGGEACEIPAYRTLAGQPDPRALEALREGVDLVTFTSSSTVRHFIDLVRQNGLDPVHLPGNPRFVCIGPITAKTAEEEGLPVALTAREYTTNGIIQALLEAPLQEA